MLSQRYEETGSFTLLESTAEADVFDVDVSDLDSNRRYSPRVPFYARVELPWHESRVVRGRDLSLGGLSVLCRDGRLANRPEHPVHLRFRVPGGDFVNAQARVVSQRPCGNDLKLGLEFTTMTREGSVQIYQLIRQRS